MATSITDSWSVSLFDSTSFLGFTRHNSEGCLILTDERTTTVYKVSDQHKALSFTLKSDAKFRLPVVFDFEEKKFVAVVDQLDKRRLCIWGDDCADYKDWKKKHLLTEIEAIVSVAGSEPLVVTADKTACWLSQLGESDTSISLLPEVFKNEDVELSKFRAYKYGTKTELIFHIDTKDKSLAYRLQFTSKQVIGQPTALFKGENVQAVCRCIGVSESSYVAATNDGHRLLRSHEDKPDVEELYTLSDHLSVQYLIFLQDSDQLLISANDTSRNVGKLMIFSIKFRSVRVIKTLDSRLNGVTPVIILPSYLLTQSDTVEAHAYKFSRLTLRSMMGATSVPSTEAPESKENRVTKCMEALEKLAEKDVMVDGELTKLDRCTLLDTLVEYCTVGSFRWKTTVVEQLLAYLVVPSHVLTQVAEAAMRHDDTRIAEYMTYKIPELSEAATVTLLDYFIKGAVHDDSAMDIDDTPQDGLPILHPDIAVKVNALLDRDITDVYASEAVRKLDFHRVLILLKYLSRMLSDDTEERDSSLDDEHIGRWCAVILDAHYTQIILSEHAQLLVELHENVRLQVELHSNILKLGSNVAYKPPVKKPSQGPYSIEAVTFYY